METIFNQLPPWLQFQQHRDRLAKMESIFNPCQQRALVLLDGHSSRLNPRLWQKCAALGVDVFCFPSHSTHLIQPLDKYPNAKFKQSLGGMKLAKPSYQDAHGFSDYMDSVKAAISEALNPRLIVSSFRDTGIIPFNPSVILSSLPCLCPLPFKQSKESTRFTISDKTLTAPSVIEEMKLHTSERHDVETNQLEEGDDLDEGGEGEKVAVLSNLTTREEIVGRVMNEIIADETEC
jgi:hypothetical protein